jgi:hypothetical protein
VISGIADEEKPEETGKKRGEHPARYAEGYEGCASSKRNGRDGQQKSR